MSYHLPGETHVALTGCLATALLAAVHDIAAAVELAALARVLDLTSPASARRERVWELVDARLQDMAPAIDEDRVV